MKFILLLCMCTMVLFATKLTRSGSTVIDDTNKLMWQDTKADIKELHSHESAILYCKKLNVKGLQNWRLPSVEEYKTIINKNEKNARVMVNRAFRYVKADHYWASDRTWLRNFGVYGYYVFFKSGTIYYQNRNEPKYVKCVRDLR